MIQGFAAEVSSEIDDVVERFEAMVGELEQFLDCVLPEHAAGINAVQSQSDGLACTQVGSTLRKIDYVQEQYRPLVRALIAKRSEMDSLADAPQFAANELDIKYG